MNTGSINRQKPGSYPSKRQLSLGGLVAFLACAACCAWPFIGVLAASGAAAATGFFRLKTDLLLGSAILLLASGAIFTYAWISRSKRCSTSCQTSGSCCHGGESDQFRVR